MKSLLLQPNQLKFNLYMPFGKSFQITDEVKEMPEEFASLQLESGYYFWGYANSSGVDLQGDLFPLETLSQMAPNLTKPPYNKIFLNHNYKDISSGTIIATAMDDKGMLILAKLNEEHSRVQESWGSIMNGNLDGLSIGGSFLQVDTIEDEESGMTFNVVRESIATEVSLTSIPVNGGSLLQGAFKKSRSMMKAVEDLQYNKSIKIESKGDDKKFFINEDFMKSFAGYKDFAECERKNKDKQDPSAYCGDIKRKTEKSQDDEKNEKYIKNSKLSKSMVDKKDLNAKQKEVFDKAVSDGKTEDEALKLASAILDEEAVEGVKTKNEELAENPMKTGKENEATKKKELKKSVDEDESTEEGSEASDETKDDADAQSEDEKDETDANADEDATEDSAELESDPEAEKEETVDYKEKYEKALKENEELRSELSEFKKSLPGKKPLRKSIKTKQGSNAELSNSPKQKGSFLGWLKAGN